MILNLFGWGERELHPLCLTLPEGEGKFAPFRVKSEASSTWLEPSIYQFISEVFVQDDKTIHNDGPAMVMTQMVFQHHIPRQ